MPSIILHLNAEQPIDLPVDDNHLRQGLVYHLLRENAELSEQLHRTEPGIRNVYKLFTFTPLRMEKMIFHEDQVMMQGRGSMEIRSVHADIIKTITEAAMKRDRVRIGRGGMALEGMELKDLQLQTRTLPIRMLSPVVLHHTAGNGYRHYVSPMEDDFAVMADWNFRNKYAAWSGEETEEHVQIRLARPMTKTDWYTGHYKGTIVSGAYGHFVLEGDPEMLTFLYHCGLGARNAEGFGCFEPEWT